MTSRVLFTSVLVGVDHDQGGRDAISLAKQLRAGEGALTLAHVYVEEPIVYRGVSAQYEASQRQDDLERLRQASEQTGVRAQLRWCRASSVGRGLHEALRADRRGPPRRRCIPTPCACACSARRRYPRRPRRVPVCGGQRASCSSVQALLPRRSGSTVPERHDPMKTRSTASDSASSDSAGAPGVTVISASVPAAAAARWVSSRMDRVADGTRSSRTLATRSLAPAGRANDAASFSAACLRLAVIRDSDDPQLPRVLPR